ncbi:uncharacterized protein JCM10292_000082 [Rhodotorula paludigena]|uniref:uncharacterized protein n=1 Tax=Rhodotorula paludigena TaxID=86838 RepID=UPI00316B9CBD
MTLLCFGHPPVDPSTQKALALPIANPLDRHGRIFFFAWLSFGLSFLSWYAMPPLLNATIKRDLNLTDNEVSNSTIIGGVASLLVRLIAGPLCDRFGPRYVLIGTLILSAIPCGAAGTAHNALGLYFVRFFMGIAGAAFVPCQALMAAWFDKRVIGTASAFAAGWGDAGVGVTFFVMPAVFNSFRGDHDHPERVAWRLSFLVPCILQIVCGVAVLLLNDDTPTGTWKSRHLTGGSRRESTEPILFSNRTRTKSFSQRPTIPSSGASFHFPTSGNSSMTVITSPPPAAATPKRGSVAPSFVDLEKAQATATEVRRGSEAPTLAEPAGPRKQTAREVLADLCCLQTFMLAAGYFATFGIALTMNAILVNWYMSPSKFGRSQSLATDWAALFGLLNVVTRPFGGIMGDVLYRRFGEHRGLQAKKFWISFLCVMGGGISVLVGLLNPSSPAAFLALLCILAFFIEAGNGAVYALLPHVNPHINGLMGGVVGGSGNLGGIVYTTVARYSSFAKTTWTIGVASAAVGVAIALVNPVVPQNRRTMYS